MSTSQTPEEPMAAFEEAVETALMNGHVAQDARATGITWEEVGEHMNDLKAAIRQAAQSYGDQRVRAELQILWDIADQPQGLAIMKLVAAVKHRLEAVLPTGNAGKTEEAV